MRELDGRVAVVTGASRGIGPYLAAALAAAGAEVVLVARDGRRLEHVAARLHDAGRRALALPIDLLADGATDEVVRTVQERRGRVDVLVNNAGVETLRAFTDTDPEALARTVELDLTIPLLLTRQALPGMLERGEGHVTFMSSLMGKSGAAYHAAYSAAKAGLIGLTQALRREHAGAGVGFSAICPGLVSGAGMYADMGGEGGRAPRLLGTVTPGQVARATVDAIRRDLPETIVTGTPVRPLLALGALAPRVLGPIVDAFGVTQMYRRAASRDGSASPST